MSAASDYPSRAPDSAETIAELRQQLAAAIAERDRAVGYAVLLQDASVDLIRYIGKVVALPPEAREKIANMEAAQRVGDERPLSASELRGL